jgi:hypothetical protein
MTHVLAGAFEKQCWVRDFGTTKEANVDMLCESTDVCKCSVANAGGRVPVVQHDSNIVATIPQDVKPSLRDLSELAGLSSEPGVDRRIAFGRVGKSE